MSAFYIFLFRIDWVINGVTADSQVKSMVHVEETTSHRRFAGFFIRNAEHAQRVFNTIRTSPLPSAQAQQRKAPGQAAGAGGAGAGAGAEKGAKPGAGAWQPKRQVRIAA